MITEGFEFKDSLDPDIRYEAVQESVSTNIDSITETVFIFDHNVAKSVYKEEIKTLCKRFAHFDYNNMKRSIVSQLKEYGLLEVKFTSDNSTWVLEEKEK